MFDITLQSLKGVAWVSSPDDEYQNDDDIPKMTAAVAFSGSASNMQVGTHLVCPRTGNLLVESDMARTLPRGFSSSSSSPAHPLIAHWGHEDERGTTANGKEENSFKRRSSHPPHLSISISPQDPELPSIPVAESNRDSKIVQNTNISTEDLSEEEQIASDSDNIDDKGQSIVWSQTSAAMPEIIEFNVNLKVRSKRKMNGADPVGYLDNSNAEEGYTFSYIDSLFSDEDSLDYSDDECIYECYHSQDSDEDAAVHEIGVAYLVLYGNHKRGTTILDLPLKRLRGPQDTKLDNIVVDPNSTLRIRIDAYPHGKKGEATTPELKTRKNAYQNGKKGATASTEEEEEEEEEEVRTPYLKTKKKMESAYNAIDNVLREIDLAGDVRKKRLAKTYKSQQSLENQETLLCGAFEMFVSNCSSSGSSNGNFFRSINLDEDDHTFSTILTTPSTRKTMIAL